MYHGRDKGCGDLGVPLIIYIYIPSERKVTKLNLKMSAVLCLDFFFFFFGVALVYMCGALRGWIISRVRKQKKQITRLGECFVEK